MIGFFLRALRICSEEFLGDECNYILEAFSRLMYPLGLLRRLRKKAESIWKRSTDTGLEEEENVGEGDCVVVPYAKSVEPISRFLARCGVKIVIASGKKIRDYVARNSHDKVSNEDSIVYRIPCGGCLSAYYGETSRGIRKRINEHKGDLRHHRTTNSMVVHAEEQGHLTEWDGAEILHSGLEKKTKKMVEAAYISTERVNNHKEGFYKLSRAAARLVIFTTGRARGSQSATGGTRGG